MVLPWLLSGIPAPAVISPFKIVLMDAFGQISSKNPKPVPSAGYFVFSTVFMNHKKFIYFLFTKRPNMIK
jgi:hypothetical protein